MTVESFILYLLIAAILTAHLATLRILTGCERRLSGIAPEASELIDGVITPNSELITHQMTEVCRIGADIADLIEALVDANSPRQMVEAATPSSVQETIMQLMVDKFLAKQHGNSEQERTIHQQQEAQTPNDNLDEDSETTL
jgi:hypothetical protein